MSATGYVQAILDEAETMGLIPTVVRCTNIKCVNKAVICIPEMGYCTPCMIISRNPEKFKPHWEEQECKYCIVYQIH